MKKYLTFLFLLVFLFPFGVFADNTNNETSNGNDGFLYNAISALSTDETTFLTISVDDKQYKVPVSSIILSQQIGRTATLSGEYKRTNSGSFVLSRYITEDYEYNPDNNESETGVTDASSDSGVTEGSSSVMSDAAEYIGGCDWGIPFVKIVTGSFLPQEYDTEERNKFRADIHLEQEKANGGWEEVGTYFSHALDTTAGTNNERGRLTFNIRTISRFPVGGTYRYRIKAQPIKGGEAITKESKTFKLTGCGLRSYDTIEFATSDIAAGDKLEDNGLYCYYYNYAGDENNTSNRSMRFTATKVEMQEKIKYFGHEEIMIVTTTPGPCVEEDSPIESGGEYEPESPPYPNSEESSPPANRPAPDDNANEDVEGNNEQASGVGVAPIPANTTDLDDTQRVILSNKNSNVSAPDTADITNSLGDGAKKLTENAKKSSTELKEVNKAYDDIMKGKKDSSAVSGLIKRGFSEEDIKATYAAMGAIIGRYKNLGIKNLAFLEETDAYAAEAFEEILYNAKDAGRAVASVLGDIEGLRNLAESYRLAEQGSSEAERLLSRTRSALAGVNNVCAIANKYKPGLMDGVCNYSQKGENLLQEVQSIVENPTRSIVQYASNKFLGGYGSIISSFLGI